jgi:uncharacterized membrane protein
MKTLAVIAIVLLALLGAFSAITRAMVVLSVLRGAPANELSPEDQANLQAIATAIGVNPVSQRYRDLEEDIRAGSARYNAVPYATLAHVVPGTMFLLLAPMQLLGRLRAGRPRIHRRMGYVLLALAIPFAATGLYLSFRDPLFGIVGASASGLAAMWFIYCGVRAYAAIRRHDIADHRAWMLRFLAIAYAIAVIRALDLAVLALVPVRPQLIGGPSFWVGFLLSAFIAEWWIRRAPPPLERALKWAS